MRISRSTLLFVLLAASLFGTGCRPGTGSAETYDLILRNGTVYDGSGGPPLRGTLP